MNGNRFDWWSNLRHGGLLLDTPRLAALLPEDPPELSAFHQDRLRRRLTQFQDDPAAHRGEFVSFVLEGICGFSCPLGEWHRGSQVKTEWSRKAITGESVRPRHLWIGKNGATLPVFIDDQHRLGIGKGRRGISQVLGWLRHGKQQLAIVTNGGEWRLVFAGLDYDAFCQWDVNSWFAEGSGTSELNGFRALLAPDLWTPPKEGEASPLLGAINNSRKGQADLSQILGERVRQAAELLIQAHTPSLKEHINSLEPQDIYRAAVRMIMRLVVILFAESREGLLVRDNPVFHSAYSLQGLREQLERISKYKLDSGVGAYPRILSLLRLIHEGSSHAALPVPAYGGELFAPGRANDADGMKRALHFFETATFGEHQAVIMTDYQVQQILDLLTRTKVKIRQGRTSMLVPAPVDFSTLDSEYIGILYEGLLDFELRCAVENEPIVFLAIGNQPALPLTMLLAMDDRAIKNLLEKLKDTSSDGSDEEFEAEDAGEEAAEQEDTDEPTGVETEEVEESPSDEPASEPTADDPRFSLRQRAEEWALHACRVGKLVARPRGRASPETQMQYERALAIKARQLVVKVVLPGEWYLVRWGGTRKGSGTFYTRPQLAIPTVHRTLRPLAYDPPLGADGEPDTNAPAEAWKPKSPEQILKLKVCDPACGSGSFPLSALRFLTNALYESLVVHDRIRDHGGRAVLDLIREEQSQQMLSSEALPCRPEEDEFEPRTRAILRRYVVERCIYGVDLDPLAVELCRLSLWIETMDRSLPLTFLNHKIKCGNSLVGAWFDQFLHYPAMAWEREGGDKSHTNGVHFPKEGWTKAIKAFKARVKPDLMTLIDGGTLNYFVDLTTIGHGHDAAESVLSEIHALGINQVAERAARYEALEASLEFQQLKAAFDLWCALWFWPADQLEHAPLPTQFVVGEIGEEGREIARQVVSKQRFFHWELEFPDVFNSASHGFDACLGNPPWDIAKPSSKEFFSAIDPLYRSYGKQEALQKQKQFFQRDHATEEHWLAYSANFKAMGNWVKFAGFPFGDRVGWKVDAAPGEKTPFHDFNLGDRGRSSFNTSQQRHTRWKNNRDKSSSYVDSDHAFRHQGSADINLYKLFLEQAYALLHDNGRLGLIVPSGLYSDFGTGDLRRLFVDESRWEWLFGFENREKVFDIDSRFKFNPIIVAKGGQTRAIRTAFMRRGLADWEQAETFATEYTREQVVQFSPKSRAILEIQSQRDLEVLTKIYANSVLLGDQSERGWDIKYAREFDMTNDSKLFPPRTRWEEWGYRPDEYSRWIKGPWQPIQALYAELGVRPLPGGELRCAQPPYDRLPLPRADIPEGIILSREATHFIREDEIPDVAFNEETGKQLTMKVGRGRTRFEVVPRGFAIALPVYEGRMVGQLDFSSKGWVSGSGRTAIWQEVSWYEKQVQPQYLMGQATYEWSFILTYLATIRDKFGEEECQSEWRRMELPVNRMSWMQDRSERIAFMDVTSATNERTMIAALATRFPYGNSSPVFNVSQRAACLTATLDTFSFDAISRARCAGLHLNWFVVEEAALPTSCAMEHQGIDSLSLRLVASDKSFASQWRESRQSWRSMWAVTSHERLRLRCQVEAIVATAYGLSWAEFSLLLAFCDYPSAISRNNSLTSRWPPKGFWRVDKEKHPEHRHTILSLIAFHDLQEKLASAGGDVNAGIEVFCSQNDGEGWMLPETLRLADYGLGHDDRAREHQSVRECFGPRFYDWQLAQSAEESWRECHLHARNLLGPDGYQALLDELAGKPPAASGSGAEPKAKSKAKRRGQQKLFETQDLPLFPDRFATRRQNMPANVGELFYTGEVPWHGLGMHLAQPATMEQALRAGSLDWEVGEVDLMTADAPPSPVPKRKAIVRLDRPPGDDRRVLGVGHRGFTPLQNRDGAMLFDAIFGQGRAVYHAGGYLGNGEVVWLLAKINKTLEIGRGDIVEPYALFANSHDGSMAFSIRLTTVRVVCSNTLALAFKEKNFGHVFRRAHQGSFREHSTAAQRFFSDTLRELDNVADSFTSLARKRCDEETFDRLLMSLLPDPTPPRNSEKNPGLLKAFETRSLATKQARERIKELRTTGRGMELEGARGTFWGALNAVLEYIDHHKETKSDKMSYVLLGDGMDFKVKAFRIIGEYAHAI